MSDPVQREVNRAPLLLVEDDRAIAEGLERDLRANGYDVTWVATGRDALAAVEAAEPLAVLLDLGLPDLDGVHVCRQIRARRAGMPIIVITARDAEIDVVVGLDAGASDYVTKPFSTHVLLARLRAHLRDAALDATGVESSRFVTVGELELDVDAHRARLAGVELELRPKEFALLARFCESAGRVLTREQLLSDLWDLDWDTSTKTLDMHVHALRRKLGARSDGPAWITTIRSVGYRFES